MLNEAIEFCEENIGNKWHDQREKSVETPYINYAIS